MHSLIVVSTWLTLLPLQSPVSVARLESLQVKPAYSRTGVLAGLGLPTADTLVAWIRAPVDAYRCPDGTPGPGEELSVDVRMCDLPGLGEGATVGVRKCDTPVDGAQACWDVTPRGSSRSRLFRVELKLPGAHVREDVDYELRFPASAQTVLHARTARADGAFRFAAVSCNRPFVNDGGVLAVHRQSWHALRQLEARVGRPAPAYASYSQAYGDAPGQAAPPVDFVLGLGDQIYVETTDELALFAGDRADEVRFTDSAPDVVDAVYRLHFALPPLREALAGRPWVMAWDDHEIRDGWGSQGDEHEPAWRGYFAAARDAFVGYQAARNPSLGEKAWIELPKENLDLPPELFTRFDWGAHATFFVMDQRSVRTPRHVASDDQLAALGRWLQSRHGGPGTVFFLVSPSPLFVQSEDGVVARFYAEWMDEELQDDIADEYARHEDFPALERLLRDFFLANPQHALVVLSGDIHASAVHPLAVREPNGLFRVIGHEVISSGLTNPYEVKAFKEEAVGRLRAGATLVPINGLLSAFESSRPFGEGASSLMSFKIRDRRDCTRFPHGVCAEVLRGGSGTVVGTANFAEIRVEPSTRAHPRVSVHFHVSGTETRDFIHYRRKTLMNAPGAWMARPMELSTTWGTLFGLRQTRAAGANRLHAHSLGCETSATAHHLVVDESDAWLQGRDCAPWKPRPTRWQRFTWALCDNLRICLDGSADADRGPGPRQHEKLQ